MRATARTGKAATLRTTCLLLHLAIWICSTGAAGALPEQVVVTVKYEHQTMHVTSSVDLRIPRTHAGSYVEWTNEREFLARRRLIEHATYQVTANIVRVNVSQFPAGWGDRSGKSYSTFHLEALSAKRFKEK